mgnify:CR=1 FL=1|jgi:hypothetical protein
MADICVIYDSEDEKVTRNLVTLLRNQWNVWWAEDDIPQGDWEQQVREQISHANAVVPVLSFHTEKNDIFKDELAWAKKCGRLIFPFFINEAELPFGFGGLNRTDAFDWDGAVNHPGFQQLAKKIRTKIGCYTKTPKRLSSIDLGRMMLQLPCFVFSLSSHESQVSPKDGVNLFQLLEPAAGLISSYDAWKYHKEDRVFFARIKRLRQSKCALFLDSGNYEASHKDDHYSKKHNPDGWRRDCFRKMASKIKPDIAFAFDKWPTTGGIDEITNRIVRNFRADERAIRELSFPLCPIVHLPEKHENIAVAECASQIVAKVVKKLDPVMVAIPERELGDGLIARVRTVRDIRNALNGLGRYYPLHLLGTGNPITMIALAAAGADSFDGLEWCRTVADYDDGTLFHFQHFDCFREKYFSRVQLNIRKIIENEEATYTAQVASYNLDFFTDLTRTIQDMIHRGNVEHLLKQIPNIGAKIFKEITE